MTGSRPCSRIQIQDGDAGAALGEGAGPWPARDPEAPLVQGAKALEISAHAFFAFGQLWPPVANCLTTHRVRTAQVT